LTGGHFHANWKIKPFRTMILNAIAWTAQMEVPNNGVPSTYRERMNNPGSRPRAMCSEEWQI